MRPGYPPAQRFGTAIQDVGPAPRRVHDAFAVTLELYSSFLWTLLEADLYLAGFLGRTETQPAWRQCVTKMVEKFSSKTDSRSPRPIARAMMVEDARA